MALLGSLSISDHRDKSYGKLHYVNWFNLIWRPGKFGLFISYFAFKTA